MMTRAQTLKVVVPAAFILLLLVVIAGCASPRPVSTTESLSVGWPLVVYYRPGEPTLTAEESRAIAVAQQYLEKNAGKAIDAYYRPRKTNDGYHVGVVFVVGYDAGDNPKLTGPSSVVISEAWEATGYIRF